MSAFNASRRGFLKQAGIIGGGLVIGMPLTACANRYPYAKSGQDQVNVQPNAYLQITQGNQIHFYMGRSEMGQGTYTGLTTLIAEELDVPPESIHIHHATAHKAFNNPDFGLQVTGGSTSMKSSYLPMRQAGADTRALILQAATRDLNAKITELTTQDGSVIYQNKQMPYGQFIPTAISLDVPDETPLKPDDQFKYIGKTRPRLDAIAKSTGTAEFGMDVDIPNLHRAVLLRCPVARGTVKSVDDQAARQVSGVKSIVTIYNGVAVVAQHYWQAKQAAAQLKVEWNIPETLSRFSSDSGEQLFKDALDSDDYDEGTETGIGLDGLDQSEQVITADYWAPYLAHATMEPMNCTVKIENGQCDVWVGCQSPGIAKGIAAFHAGVSKDNVTLHSTFLGGGFGRRATSDYVAEAAAIAKASGLPIQLIWSREDDTKCGIFRPASMARLNVGVDKKGRINTWAVHRAGPNIMPYTMDEAIDAMAPGFLPDGMVDWMSKAGYAVYDGMLVDHSGVEGLYKDYDAPNKVVHHTTVDPGLPVGFWRSVGHSFSGFFKESMMDEVAHTLQQDPLEFRKAHCQANPRLAKAIEIAKEKSGWPVASQPDRFLGIAAHTSFLAAVAQIAEVSIKGKKIIVHNVICVIDCGRVVNPDMVVSQMHSGIIFGLSAALYGKITLKNGVVQQSNFHDYPVLRMPESPTIDVHMIDSSAPPTGVGEPATPPIAAAIANAVFTATGQRLRKLPLTLS